MVGTDNRGSLVFSDANTTITLAAVLARLSLMEQQNALLSNTVTTLQGQVDFLRFLRGPKTDRALYSANVSRVVGQGCSMALTAESFPVVAYLESDLGLVTYICSDETCLKQPVTKRILHNHPQAGYFNTVKVTASTNLPVVAYYQASDDDLYLAVCQTRNCSSVVLRIVDSNGDVGGWTSLAFTVNGAPVISYAGDQGLKIAICNDLQCAFPIIRLLDTGNVQGTSLALTSFNSTLGGQLAVVSYFDAVHGDLKYARCFDVNCSIFTNITIDSAGEVGSYSSLALRSPDNRPFISYFDYTARDLKVATCNSTSCSSFVTRTLDSDGITGAYTSVSLDSAGNPIIGYATDTTVKIAVCSDSECATTPAIRVLGGNKVDSLTYTSMALRAPEVGEEPVFAYVNGTASTSLRVLSCSDAACLR